MDYEEILTPVALYRDRLKAEHAENSAAAKQQNKQKSDSNEVDFHIRHGVKRYFRYHGHEF